MRAYFLNSFTPPHGQMHLPLPVLCLEDTDILHEVLTGFAPTCLWSRNKGGFRIVGGGGGGDTCYTPAKDPFVPEG